MTYLFEFFILEGLKVMNKMFALSDLDGGFCYVSLKCNMERVMEPMLNTISN